MGVLRNTKSICPTCHKDIPAEIVEKEGKIVLRRKCHNTGDVYLADTDDYEQFLEYYEILKSKCYKSYGISVQLTTKCDLNCPVCFVDTHKRQAYDEPTLAKLKKIASTVSEDDITLTGGEPTQRSDLPDILKMIGQTSNRSMLVTNGLKISDIEYLRSLKMSGLNSVRLSLDGFDNKIFKTISGAPILKSKLQAVHNLKELNIPTVIEFTATRGVNEQDISKLLDIAIENPNINAIGIRSYLHLGAAGLSHSNSYSVFELAHLVRPYEEIEEFMKFYMLVSHYFKISNCPYLWYHIMIRDNGKLVSFNEIFNLAKAKEAINENIELIKNKKPSKLHFVTAVLPKIINSKSKKILSHVGWSFVKKLFGRPLNVGKFPSSFVFLMIEGACDLYYYDKDFQHCTGRDYCPEKGTVTILDDNIKREKSR